jgi:hypothetical protein
MSIWLQQPHLSKLLTVNYPIAGATGTMTQTMTPGERRLSHLFICVGCYDPAGDLLGSVHLRLRFDVLVFGPRIVHRPS